MAPENVAIYKSAKDVPGKYKKLAVVTAEITWDPMPREDMYWALQEKAGQLGANGIILKKGAEPDAEAIVKAEAIAIFIYPKSKKQEQEQEESTDQEPWARALITPSSSL